ncbi:unnamed protein product [Moneuplotes crassus]|uniref:DAGKc domain-containing protein n=1 Tax=Euplotes crassus TaxID=5936 RepID=A0AAD1X1X5_EUPCR|nr:unnamed protein product [Moneuplotes crassus]
MGGSKSYGINCEQLDLSYLGLCKAPDHTAYYFLNEDHGLFTLPQEDFNRVREEYSHSRTKNLQTPLQVICKYNGLVMAEFKDDDNEVKIHYLAQDLLYPLDKLTVNFLVADEYEAAKERLRKLTKLCYGNRKRNIAILINPISGKQESYNIYKTKLRPMLKVTRMNYKVFKTDGPDFIDKWVSRLKFKQKTYEEREETLEEEDQESSLICEYTDIVVIGGDGLLSLYLNSCYKHHFFNTLIKIPILILPGGTGNALSMDLGGKNIFNLCIKFLRGETVKGDLIRADFMTSKISVLCTAFCWGFVSKVIEKSDSWRGCLGASRYTVCGAREVLCAGGPWSMRTHQLSKIQHNVSISEDICKVSSTQPLEEVKDQETDESDNLETSAVPIIEKHDIKSDRSCYTNSGSYKLIKEASMNGNMITRGEFDFNQEILQSQDNQNMERMSQLGAIIDQRDEVDWTNIDLSEISIMVLTTHECRRSGSKEVFAPFTRINDGKMFLCGFKECSKLEMLMMMAKVSTGKGNQVRMSKYFHQEVKQIRIHPNSETCFNVDGEVYDSDEVILTCLPGMINLFGEPYKIQ